MYGPVELESRNCEPPKLVQASTMTTTASGQSPVANRWSSRSRNVGSNAVRFAHMSIWPV